MKWQTQNETPSCWEKGGGEKLAIDEPDCDINLIYLQAVAKGVLGSTVAHAAGPAIDEARATAMMKNAMKCPKYMDHSEIQNQLKKLNKQLGNLQTIKEEREKYNGNE